MFSAFLPFLEGNQVQVRSGLGADLDRFVQGARPRVAQQHSGAGSGTGQDADMSHSAFPALR